ncbi:MAG: hypothetical protein LBD06_09385 [Candidatus Accumulibacter sp.]|nr:hypothetical protein [Accumulibacter sp.]
MRRQFQRVEDRGRISEDRGWRRQRNRALGFASVTRREAPQAIFRQRR